jgi:alkanesulfonate monooxygenase SsuD/methylene tetrahydromethanopterin reductase-like flavin-dependent oxidoreductase (luciferase family)
MLKLMAEQADGWNTTWVTSPEELIPLNADVDAACESVGRDPKSLHRSACVFVDTPARTGRNLPTQPGVPPARSANEIAELFLAYADQEMDHIMLWIDPNNGEGIEEVGRALELLDS